MSSRSKRKERNRNREQQKQLKSQEVQKKSVWRWLSFLSPTGALAASIALFLTVVGSYYAFSPKISINPSITLDPTKPFMTTFVVRNDSLLPINSIKIKCKFGKIILDNDATFIGTKEAGFTTNIPPIPSMSSGEESTFLLPYPTQFIQQVKFADVSAEITYSPSLLPFKKKALKRFVTVSSENGTFRWISKAISEK